MGSLPVPAGAAPQCLYKLRVNTRTRPDPTRRDPLIISPDAPDNIKVLERAREVEFESNVSNDARALLGTISPMMRGSISNLEARHVIQNCALRTSAAVTHELLSFTRSFAKWLH